MVATFCSITSPTRSDLGKARPAGFEPATGGLEVLCSIQLSYERRKVERSVSGARTHHTAAGRPSLRRLNMAVAGRTRDSLTGQPPTEGPRLRNRRPGVLTRAGSPVTVVERFNHVPKAEDQR